jgi:2-aminoadipate transaminase
MNLETLLASRTKMMGTNAIREILKVVSQPGMISLAGGIPAPESFPMEIIGELTEKILWKFGSKAFQYDPTEGFGPLREALAEHLKRSKIETSANEILIGSGSQGVLDSIGKVLISKGDKIAVEAPTYLGAIQAFNPYEPQFVTMDTDDDGLIPLSLEEVLRGDTVKLVYLVPTFQNPTGRTIPFERRKEIATIIEKHGALLVEDDPYSALRYQGSSIPPIKAFVPENVIYVSTLSKVLAPGLRIGFSVAPKLIRKWLVIVKQGTDLHTSTFSQALGAEYLSGGHMKHQLPKIISLYKPKHRAMLDALGEYFPDGFRWSKPEGGMFLWAEGPQGIDMERIYWKSIKKKVAFVPGKFFYTQQGRGIETMRLNFTMTDEHTIDTAIETISEVIKEEL